MNAAGFDAHARLDSPVHRLDARLKIALTLGSVVTIVSTPPEAYAAFAGYALFLLSVLLLARVPPAYALKRLSVVLPFVGAVALFIPFLPAETASGGYNLGWGALSVSRPALLVLWNVLAKSLLGALAATLLTATTPFPQLLAGLEQLYVPRLFVLIVSFAYRYLFVLRDEAVRMCRARDSRCYSGRWLWQAATLGRLLGTLFLRSYERGERLYLAMLARGYEGCAAPPPAAAPKPRDWLCACGASGALLLLRLSAL